MTNLTSQFIYVLIDIRSANNVGALLRTADGLGVEKVVLIGTTPYPGQKNDSRLPHVIKNTESKIRKTALGAETSVSSQYFKNFKIGYSWLKKRGYTIVSLEQSPGSTPLSNFEIIPRKLALVLGSETSGLSSEVLTLSDQIIEIPMKGQKESLNVAIAGAIAMYDIINKA